MFILPALERLGYDALAANLFEAYELGDDDDCRIELKVIANTLV